MKLVSQYGHDALNTHDFVMRLGSNNAEVGACVIAHLLSLDIYKEGLTFEDGAYRLSQSYREFGSQPMTKEMFVSPRDPCLNPNNWAKWWAGKEDEIDFDGAIKAYENHQPLFEGEWEVVKQENTFHKSGFTHAIKYKGKTIEVLELCKTLNDFLTENKGLKYNKLFET